MTHSESHTCVTELCCLSLRKCHACDQHVSFSTLFSVSWDQKRKLNHFRGVTWYVWTPHASWGQFWYGTSGKMNSFGTYLCQCPHLPAPSLMTPTWPVALALMTLTWPVALPDDTNLTCGTGSDSLGALLVRGEQGMAVSQRRSDTMMSNPAFQDKSMKRWTTEELQGWVWGREECQPCWMYLAIKTAIRLSTSLHQTFLRPFDTSQATSSWTDQITQ